MSTVLNDRIQAAVDHAASALFGGAVAYAVFALSGAVLLSAQASILAGGAGALSFLLCVRRLKALGAPKHAFASFEAPEFDQFEDEDELLLTEADKISDELVLTESDRLDTSEPLVLDDILAKIGPDSRVVRLFDRKSMPTPGQLQSRIDSHLGQATAEIAKPDASQALSDALAELRRSLR